MLTVMQTDTTAQHLTRLLDKTLDKNEEVVTTTEEFDTSQPVDSLTGSPPLKMRTVEHRRTVSLQQERASENSDVRSGSTLTAERQHETHTATDTAIESDTHSEVVQRFGMSWLQKTLCYIGVATLAALLLLVAWRLLKRYLTTI